MAVVDRRRREVLIKLVYLGPGLAGKTTNLSYVFERTAPGRRSALVHRATEHARTLSFEIVPTSISPIDGHAVRCQLVTTPSSLMYDASRRHALEGADGVVFVTDSQIERADANAEDMERLIEHLASYGRRIGETPLVLQYNKRDLPNAAPVAELSRRLNPRNVPEFTATARLGEGVFDTLRAIANATTLSMARPLDQVPSGALRRDEKA